MTSRQQVGPWPEEAAKLFAALQERMRGVPPEAYAHLADAVGSVAAAVRVLMACPATTATTDDGGADDNVGENEDAGTVR